MWKKICCLLMGHEPCVDMQENDSWLICQRCGKRLELFVKNVRKAT